MSQFTKFLLEAKGYHYCCKKQGTSLKQMEIKIFWFSHNPSYRAFVAVSAHLLKLHNIMNSYHTYLEPSNVQYNKLNMLHIYRDN
jgi:hypothetical protein